MSMFVYFSIFCTILAAPVASSENVKKPECTENGDCIEKNSKIDHNCICNDSNAVAIPYYNEMIDEFGNEIGNVSIVDIKQLLQTLTERHNTQDKIQKEVEAVFQGVIVAVILFGVCASLCVVTACIYCCRINIIDSKLKSDTEALAEKLKRECRFKSTIKRTPLEPISESCNIIVEDAGVYCV